MRTHVDVELNEVLSLVVCAEDYGWDLSILMHAFWEMIGEKLTDEEIEAYVSDHYGGNYEEEDFWEWRHRLSSFRNQFSNPSE